MCWQRAMLFCPFLVLSLSFVNVHGLLQNKCQLSNGNCQYEIQIKSECDRNAIADRPQDDEVSSVQVERMLLESTSEQSQRLRSLESRIDAMIQHIDASPRQNRNRKSPSGVNAGNTTSGVPRRTRTTGQRQKSDGFKRDPQRKENNMLNKVHKQFTGLREEISRLKFQLDRTRGELANTSSQLNLTRDDLSRTSAALSRTQERLDDKISESHSLKGRIDDLEGQLNESESELTKTRSELMRAKIENRRHRFERDDCLKRLEACLREKEDLRRALRQALAKYHELNIRHENVTKILNLTQDELYTCYRGKTTNFCSFEDPAVCGFAQESNEDATDWRRWRKSTPSTNTGPSRDHTCRNGRGYYMYLEATSMTRGKHARLLSPRYMGRGEQCVEFYYHMYGDQTGTLSVYTDVPRQQVVPRWRGSGNQGNVWTMARIEVPEPEANKGYQVIFDAVAGTGSAGDIAIDDVRVFDGACFEKQPNQTESANRQASAKKNSPPSSSYEYGRRFKSRGRS